jgi:GNAT superfamily N-acetyltransferase
VDAAPHVRPATAADVSAIGEVQLRAWRAGYAGRVPAEALEGLTAADLAARWSAAVASPPTPAHRVLAAVDGVLVAGFAALAPATEPDLGPDVLAGELLILVVDPAAGRRGHGSRLLNAAVDHLRDDGATLAVAWVLSTDDALRAFLASSGWAPDGAWRELDTGSGATIKQIRMHTSLA